MARRQIARSLPKLPKPAELPSRGHRTEQLLNVLRKLALTSQGNQPQPFYSVRDIGSHFRVPLATVSAVFKQMEREGVLTSVRGSQTTLSARKYDRKLTVRGFVGLPTSLTSFMTLPYRRMFLLRLRRELRLRGFAAAILLLDQPDELEIIDRIRYYEIDTVIWSYPDRSARPRILQLRDFGVRVIGIRDSGTPSIRCRYELRRDEGISRILTDWVRSKSVRSIVLLTSSGRSASAGDEMQIQALLHEKGIPFRLTRIMDDNFEAALRATGQEKGQGVILLAPTPSMFSFRLPNDFAKLLRNNRVALLHGFVDIPFTHIPDVFADVVAMDWQAVSKTIVDDLITQVAFKESLPTVFQAVAHLRVPLRNFAHAI
jgi:hypothetical protein